MPCLGTAGGADPRGPPKKIKLAEGQTRMKSFFGRSTNTYESSMESDYPELSSSETGETIRSSSTTASVADSSDAMESGTSESSTSRIRRGVTASWRSFEELKWRTLYPWLLLKENGVYCQYCSYTRREESCGCICN